MSEKQIVKGNVTANEAHFALQDILKHYGNISINQISFFAPVFYPIAIIEMDMMEKSFEDFDMIQQMVLRCVGLGLGTPQVIAATLGLSNDYVKGVLALTEGLGQVKNGALTDIGKESLQKGQSISLNNVKQKFQIDGVHGNLLKLEQEVYGGMLVDKEFTSFNVGHLMHIDAVEESDIVKEIKTGARDYLKEKRGILNTNVEKINEISFVEMKYAKSYIMKLTNYDEAIVFVKRYNEDPNAREKKSAIYSWLPFFVNSRSLRNLLSVDEKVPVGEQKTVDRINKMIDLILDKMDNMKDESLHEIVNDTVVYLLRYTPGEDYVVIDRENRKTKVYLKDDCLNNISKAVLDIIFSVALDGGYITTRDKLSGHIIHIIPTGEYVNEIINMIKTLKSKGSDTYKITRHLKEKIINMKSQFENEKQAFAGIVEVLKRFE